jgi:hypothetical protein
LQEEYDDLEDQASAEGKALSRRLQRNLEMLRKAERTTIADLEKELAEIDTQKELLAHKRLEVEDQVLTADPDGPGRNLFRWDARSIQDLKEGRHPRQVKLKQLSRQRAARHRYQGQASRAEEHVSLQKRWQEVHADTRSKSPEAGSVPGIEDDLEHEADLVTRPLTKLQRSAQLAEDYAPWRSKDQKHVEKLTTVTERRWWSDDQRPKRIKTAEAKKKSLEKLAEKRKQKGFDDHA